MIYCYAMLLSTRSSPLRPDLSLSSSFTEAGTPLPDYHSIKATSPFSEWPRPLSLVPLPFIWRTPQRLSPLSPSSVSAPITRACASNWPPSPPPWVRTGGARGQRTDPHLPPSFLDFLPMKCLVLNYSHPTLIVIDWNSRGSGRMTDRLGSLWACPPRRRARGRRGGGSVQDNTKSHMNTIVLHCVACHLTSYWTGIQDVAKMLKLNWNNSSWNILFVLLNILNGTCKFFPLIYLKKIYYFYYKYIPIC